MSFYIRGSCGKEARQPCRCFRIRPCPPLKKGRRKPDAFRHICCRFTWDCSPRWYFRM
ncbi:MAG: hypothetical protein GX304_01305 [Clostridiales bacterium]|jgi:hypothetical protein|nr:hypothetical protein [Clostridiales bacterium]